MSETAPAVEPKKPVDPMMGEDPRVKGGEKKLVKKGGVGRNTESFDPRSSLVRPDMRILVASKDERPTALKHDDVVIVPDFFCAKDDWTLYNQLVHEMRDVQNSGVKGSEWISWHEGAHLISKNPGNSPTFQRIQQQIADYFSITNASVGTRFNWYRDSSDWKPFHHDSAAFNPQRARNQNITVGISLGATRELAFLHAKTNTRIYFPQTNGMLFSFGRDVNIQWKHGVNYVDEGVQAAQEVEYAPRCDSDVSVGRISIILWGNCYVTQDEENSPPMLTDNTRGNGHSMHHTGANHGDRRNHNNNHNNNNQNNNHNNNRRHDSRDRRDHQRDRDDVAHRREEPRGISPHRGGHPRGNSRGDSRGDSRDRGRGRERFGPREKDQHYTPSHYHDGREDRGDGRVDGRGDSRGQLRQRQDRSRSRDRRQDEHE